MKLLTALSISLSALALASCALAPVAPSVAPQASTRTLAPVPQLQKPFDIKLIAFNDFHGNLRTPSLRVPIADASKPTGLRFEPAGGVEQFAAVIAGLKAKNPLNAVLTGGDMVGATPLLSSLFKDEPTIEAMNIIGIDFHSVGNHEFDYGIAHLKRLQAGGCAKDAKTQKPDCGGRPDYAGAKFGILAANVTETATGKTLFPAYGIKTFNGVKVAFLGMTLRGTPGIVRAGATDGFTFQDEVATVNKLLPELKAQGVNAFVVVMHEGGEQTGGINECVDFKGRGREIAEKFPPEISVVVEGHTHRYYICTVGDKLVTSAGSYGTLVTEIDLTLDPATGTITNKRAQNHIVKPDGEKDPRLTAHVEAYSKLATPLENRIVGKIVRELTPVANAAGESTLGNVIADAQLAATAQPDNGGAVIAFMNPGGLRAPIIAEADGSVTYGTIFRTQPFSNELITMTVTGKQLKAILEQQFAGERARPMSVSRGFSYTYDSARAKGDRVIAETMKVNGMLVESALQYRVTANGFLASGGDGQTLFSGGTERVTGMMDVEALDAYLAANSPLAPPAVGRITRKN